MLGAMQIGSSRFKKLLQKENTNNVKKTYIYIVAEKIITLKIVL